MHAAIKDKNEAAALIMLDRGMDPREVDDFFGDTALHWAAIKGCTSVVETLLGGEHHDSLINAQGAYGFTALHRAAYNNHPTIVALLLEHPNIDINIKAHVNTPLKNAIIYNHTDCAELIRKAGGTE